MGFTRLLRVGIKKTVTFILDKLILSLPIYYKHLDKICLKKWFDVMEGNKKSLYKVDFINYIPVLFDKIILDMLFQMDYVNTEMIEKERQLAILRSISVRTRDKTMQFQADTLANEIKIKMQNYSNEKETGLNGFIDFIEMTFNQIGTIDPYKISASRAFSLYHKAVEQNKRLAKLYK